jgi:hypothetical protein
MMSSTGYLTETIIDVNSLTNYIFNTYFSGFQELILNIEDIDDFRNKSMKYLQTKYPNPTVVFMGNLDAVSSQTQQAMLKFLEEPVENLKIIFFALNIDSLLSTIKSRSKIEKLPTSIIYQHLDKELMLKVQKHLPPIGDVILQLINNTFAFDSKSIKFTDIERTEIGFWLWQLSKKAEGYYIENPKPAIAIVIEKLNYAIELNNTNVQKKMVLSSLC